MTTVELKSEGRVEDPIVTGKEIGRLLCDAVGLPIEGVREINLSIKAGEAATLTVKRFIRKSQSDSFIERLSEFVLCKPESLKGDDDE